METKALADLLRAIANLVEAPDPQNLAKLTRELSRAKNAEPVAKQNNEKSEANKRARSLEQVRDDVLQAQTREEGYEILSRHDLTQKDLSAIARSAQVHVNKSDNNRVIKEKIIETLVGAQLNARAIRGFDL